MADVTRSDRTGSRQPQHEGSLEPTVPPAAATPSDGGESSSSGSGLEDAELSDDDFNGAEQCLSPAELGGEPYHRPAVRIFSSSPSNSPSRPHSSPIAISRTQSHPQQRRRRRSERNSQRSDRELLSEDARALQRAIAMEDIFDEGVERGRGSRRKKNRRGSRRGHNLDNFYDGELDEVDFTILRHHQSPLQEEAEEEESVDTLIRDSYNRLAVSDADQSTGSNSTPASPSRLSTSPPRRPNPSSSRRQAAQNLSPPLEIRVSSSPDERLIVNRIRSEHATPVKIAGGASVRSPINGGQNKKLRVVMWNVEWMNNFFRLGLPAEILPCNPECGISDTYELCTRISQVIQEMDPDVMVFIEGPEFIEQMMKFVELFLDDEYQTFGGLDGDHQRIYTIVKKNGPFKDPQLDPETNEFLAKEWMFDVNSDFIVQSYHFTRVPLVVTGKVLVDGVERLVYVIGIHTKSKHVKRAVQLILSPNSHENSEYIRRAVKNRKRIASECARLRKCLDQCVFSKESVAGDLNDGPGMDFFEEYYLLFDSVEALLGSPFYQKKLLQPLLIRKRFVNPEDQWSASFKDPIDGVDNKKVLIDHICVSKNVFRRVGDAGIAHDLKAKYEAMLSPGRLRQSRVSDHTPCYMDAF